VEPLPDRPGYGCELGNDGAFGAYTDDHGGRAVSRDMLDSVLEINFLEEQVGLSKLPQLSVLDIGAD
jgi:hypothetical protein